MITGLFRIWQEREPHRTEIVNIEKLHVYKLRLLSCHGRPRFCETKASDVVPLVLIGCLSDGPV